MKRILVLFAAFTLLFVGVLAACAPSAPAGLSQQEVEAVANSAVEKRVSELLEKRLNEVDTKLAVWAIQPGTAPRMNELTHYFNNMWYAAQAGNWVFAEFEVYRTDETVKAIKTVRPARAQGMDKWLQESIEPLRGAVKAQDVAGFAAAYDKAIQQCNECHTSSQGGGISLSGVRVTRPTSPAYSNLNYAGS